MSQEETADLLNSDRRRHLTGIGIPNVHERLRLIYGEEYGVTIRSVIGTGTSVSLRLPYHLKNYQNYKKYVFLLPSHGFNHMMLYYSK